MAKRTMKAFDEMCLTPVEEMTPEKVRALRLRENASQAVFARHLNVTAGLVSQWERGEKRPRGASLKLLTLVAKNGLFHCLPLPHLLPAPDARLLRAAARAQRSEASPLGRVFLAFSADAAPLSL